MSMGNEKLTALCTGSGMVGGTVKGSLLTVTGSISAGAMAEVVVYAVLSALAAYLTKVALDRVMRRVGAVKPKNGAR